MILNWGQMVSLMDGHREKSAQVDCLIGAVANKDIKDIKDIKD